MKKSNLRFLALGFLSSAILLAAYVILFQGHLPVNGVNVQSVINQAADSKDSKSLQKDLDELTSTHEDLKKDKENLESNKKDMESQMKELQDQHSQLAANNSLMASQLKELGVDVDETLLSNQRQESRTEASNQDNEDHGDVVSGTFVVSPNDTSSSIADRLEFEGYIQSSDEFQALVEQYGLSSLLQSGDYQLKSSMTMDEIIDELTNHAYSNYSYDSYEDYEEYYEDYEDYE